MSSTNRPVWKVRAYGQPINRIDSDLLTQIVIMLGRQLDEEATPELTTDPETTTPH